MIAEPDPMPPDAIERTVQRVHDANAKTAAELALDDGHGNHLDAGTDIKASDIAALLRDRPAHDGPPDEVAAWVQRKEAMLRAIEKESID